MATNHVVFIHGLSNKPSPENLALSWLGALKEQTNQDAGLNLTTSEANVSFVYWADLFYESPIPGDQYESGHTSFEEEFMNKLQNSKIDSVSTNDWINNLEEKYSDYFDDQETETKYGPPTPYEAIPLPKPVKKYFMKKFVREAHAYLFNIDQVRDTIRTRVLETICLKDINNSSFENIVLVGHSQGSFIAYDVLTMQDCPEVSGFMTFGSPLGVDEIQDELNWSRNNGYPENLVGDWINVYDSLDPVSRLDPKLANDFRKNGQRKIRDINEQNWGYWRHSATKYLKGKKLRDALRGLIKGNRI